MDGTLFHFIEQTNYEKELSISREKILDLQGQNRDYEQRLDKLLIGLLDYLFQLRKPVKTMMPENIYIANLAIFSIT